MIEAAALFDWQKGREAVALTKHKKQLYTSKNFRMIMKDTRGDAIVEAAILFPIVIMIFAALVLLSIYLPTRAALQRSTQYVATALASELSDTWLFFNVSNNELIHETDKDNLLNVYSIMNASVINAQNNIKETVSNEEARLMSYRMGSLNADCYLNNKIIYKEIVVTATRNIKVPIDLSFIGFPDEIGITVTSTAVVQDGDEFIRSLGLIFDFADFIAEKYQLADAGNSIGSLGVRFKAFIGGN